MKEHSTLVVSEQSLSPRKATKGGRLLAVSALGLGPRLLQSPLIT
jgi:hypothetical protein